ncbi:MAG: hypothetical protein ABIH34_03310 [Nanoarchaeota archaeon]
MRRGVIQIQFAWVFILIVGAIMLVFFFSFSQRLKSSAEGEHLLEVRQKLSSILSNAKQSTGTFFKIQLPKEELIATCNGITLGDFDAIDVGEAFSPDLIQSIKGETYLWIQDWNIPFKVENFIYITTPEVRYVIVDDKDSQKADVLFDLLPDAITKEKLEITTNLNDVMNGIQEKRNYKVRIVYIGTETPDAVPPLLSSPDESDITALKIEPEIHPDYGVYDTHGTVTFYENQERMFVKVEEPKPYVGQAMVYAAVFAERYDHYKCVMERAFVRLKQVTEVIRDRSDALDSYYGNNEGECYDPSFYDVGNNGLNTLLNLGEFTEQGVIDIHSARHTLEGKNHGLKIASCPLIY